MRNRRGFCSNPIGSYYKEAEKLPVWSIKACQKRHAYERNEKST